jgi:hypothetical protein
MSGVEHGAEGIEETPEIVNRKIVNGIKKICHRVY